MLYYDDVISGHHHIIINIQVINKSGSDEGQQGQVLDCKVSRDEETGLPRVEMVFSINPTITAGAAGGPPHHLEQVCTTS